MGVISKAVPTVNIFIVSFPITVSIGLILSIVALPEMSVYLTKQFLDLERILAQVTAR
jgi:flagellar biosynthetic protein FliR